MNIQKISLIASESCNLHCQYCEIAESVSKIHYKENQKLKESYKNGIFFKNITKICEKFKINPRYINQIDLWGEEPTLILNDFCYIIEDLLTYFSNFNYLFFSSNFVNIDNLYNFIIKLDDILKFKKFELNIQLSYDGKYGTLINRGINPIIIEDNIIKLIKFINSYNFKSNLKININCHNVIDINILKYIEEKSSVKEYWEELFNFYNNLFELNTSNHLSIYPFIAAPMSSYNASKEDGILLGKFNKESFYLKQNYIINIEEYGCLTKHYKSIIKTYQDTYKNKIKFSDILDEVVLDMLTSTNDNKYNYALFNQYCGTGRTDLKIRYNGQVLNCHNLIYGLTEEENKENKDNYTKIVRKELLKLNYNPNLLSSSEEDINKFFEKFSYIDGKYSIPCLFSIIVNFMELLSFTNQIDYSYQIDKKKLLRHAFLLSIFLGCWENNIASTGSLFGDILGRIRWYANGTLDVLEDVLNITYSKNKRGKK